MITSAEVTELHVELRCDPRDDGPAGDVLTCLYAIVCGSDDPDDILAAWDDLRDIAVRGYDEADRLKPLNLVAS